MKLLRNLIVSPADFFAKFRDLRREGFRIVEGKNVLFFTLGLLAVNFSLGYLLEPASPLGQSMWFAWTCLLVWWFVVMVELLIKGAVEAQGYLVVAVPTMVAYLGVVHSLGLQALHLTGLYFVHAVFALNVLLFGYLLYLFYSLLRRVEVKERNPLSKGRIGGLICLWCPAVVLLLPFENVISWIGLELFMLACVSLPVGYFAVKEKLFEKSWKLPLFSLLTGGALIGALLFTFTFGYLFVHNLRQLPQVKPLEFKTRTELPTARENLRRLVNFGARHKKLEDLDVDDHDNPGELLDKYSPELRKFQKLGSAGQLQVPRAWYRASGEDTRPTDAISLVTLARLVKIKADRELQAGQPEVALEQAKFLLTTGGKLVAAEGNLMLRAIADGLRRYGIEVLKELASGKELSERQWQAIYEVVRSERRRPEPYHNLLVGEAQTFQTYFTPASLLAQLDDLNWFRRFDLQLTLQWTYGRSLHWYRLRGRKKFRHLIAMGEKPYWRLKKLLPLEESNNASPPTTIHAYLKYAHGIRAWNNFWFPVGYLLGL